MKNYGNPWLYIFFCLFLARETAFALPHPVHEYGTANEDSVTKHDGPHGSITDSTPSVAGENLCQRVLEKAGYNSRSSLLPPKYEHVALRSDGPQNIPPPPEKLHTALSEMDVDPVDNPASIALLGVILLGLAGISRRQFAKK